MRGPLCQTAEPRERALPLLAPELVGGRGPAWGWLWVCIGTGEAVGCSLGRWAVGSCRSGGEVQ